MLKYIFRRYLSLSFQALMGMGYKRLGVARVALIVIVELLALMLSIYHLTHEGRTSGALGVLYFVLLALVLFLPHSAKTIYNRLNRFQLVCLSVACFLALFFGIYHLTTPDGMRSGILELSSFALLMLAIFLPSKA